MGLEVGEPSYHHSLMPILAQENGEAEAVARAFGIPEQVLRAKVYSPKANRARAALYWILRQKGYTFPMIGILCARNHTTVISGVHRAEVVYSKERDFLKALQAAQKILTKSVDENPLSG